MKLPSNTLKTGEKEEDQDDDDASSDTELSELGSNPSVETGVETELLNEETGVDNVSVDSINIDSGQPSPSGEFSSETQNGESPDSEGESEDTENLSFSDDQNDEDEDEDEDEELKPKKKLILVGGGASAVLIIIGGILWYFNLGGVGDKSSEEDPDIPKVAMDIAPKIKRKAGGLNALIAGSAGAGSSIAPSQLLVPVIAPSAFASIPPPTVTDSPLGESNYPDLSEESPHGLLPITAEDGRQAWKVYAKPFVYQNTNPRVSIVVRGLGQSVSATNAAINLLPGNVTLAFDPYTPNLTDWMKKARAAGHEVMLMVPLEPTNFPYDDPGPLGLMTVNAPEENRLRLEKILGLMTGYIGVMTSMGSKFNTSEEHLRLFLEVIKKRGLMLLEGAINSKTLAPKIATEIGLPWALTNVVLDSIPTKAEIDIQLAELEAVLAKKSAVVAIAEGYPSSIERIGAWTTDLAAKNFVLAPLSALANKQVKK